MSFVPSLISTHTLDAYNRLTAVFLDKPLIQGLLASFTDQIQELEDGFYPFLTQLTVRNGVGKQLDLIGEWVGERRRGRNDLQYRRAIYLRIARNISKGTSEDIIDIYQLLTGATSVFWYEIYPAHVVIFGNVNIDFELINDGDDAFAFAGGTDGLGFGDLFDPLVGGGFAEIVLYDVDYFYEVMDSILAGGVRLDWLGQYPDDAFSFAGGPDGLGFGDLTDSTIGGGFARIIPPVNYV